MKAVILAGGSGERFWPLSTSDTPKQFLNLTGEGSLIKCTYRRLLERFDPENIIVVTSDVHLDRTTGELEGIPPDNIIGEPIGRNTAPACVAACKLTGPGETHLVVPADHLITDTNSFWSSFDTALKGLKEKGGLFTFGIEPTGPETGYGYIQVGEELGAGIFSVARFKEKPPLEEARSYIARGDHLWNSGMFLWNAGEMLSQMELHSPDIYGPMRDMDPLDREQMEKVYPEIPKRSVDHAIMERSDMVRTVRGSFGWSDLGSWTAIRELFGFTRSDDETVLIDSERVFIRKQSNKPMAVVGLSDIIVIESRNGILVCAPGSVQRVREVTRALKKNE